MIYAFHNDFTVRVMPSPCAFNLNNPTVVAAVSANIANLVGPLAALGT